MTTTGVTVSTTAPSPSWVARNAKFLWAAGGLVLTVATDVVNGYASVIPASWLTAVQGVILALTAIGVQRDTNAVGVAEVVSLVQHVLPSHTLVPLPAAETVLKAVEPAPAAVSQPVAASTDLSAAMDAALAGTPAAVSAVTNLPIPPVAVATPAPPA
jgi:hypothetical protein